MSDRLLFSLMAVAAALMIGLALVWPQGLGARSPGPFGHAPVLQTKAAKARAAAAPPVLGIAPTLPSAASRPGP